MIFYNEIDPFAAAWLRKLIDAGHIAAGVVDERSIEDITPDELRQYTQCHFFAGIGVWSYALRNTGWPDDRPVWTGSCPCQPFSTAGKRTGTADERHLWPAWFHLIAQCRPDVVFGEQVEAAIRNSWFDLVQTDLEAIDYAFGPVVLPAAGFGAPHLRHRLYFMAHNERLRLHAGQSGDSRGQEGAGSTPRPIADRCGNAGSVADDASLRCYERGSATSAAVQGDSAERGGQHPQPGDDGELSGRSQGLRGDGGRHVADFAGGRCEQRDTGVRGLQLFDADSNAGPVADQQQQGRQGRLSGWSDQEREDQHGRSGCSGPTYVNGFWEHADWLWCRDGKYRAVESGTFPLANGSPARVGRLRGYGNAIVAPCAEAFIRSAMESLA